MAYSELFLDHFVHPRNMGEIENPDGAGEAGSADEGDIVRLTIRVKDGIICDVKFKSFGCGAAIASSSAATELYMGLSLEEALAVDTDRIIEQMGGLPEERMLHSVLAPRALAAAAADYRSRQA